MHTSKTMFLVAIMGCWGCGEDEKEQQRYEGSEPGDCSDEADNDIDGLFDCNDEGCAGAPDCEEAEAEAPDTGVDDDDADTGTDATEPSEPTEPGNEAPTVVLLTPVDGSVFEQTEAVEFSAVFGDDADEVTDLTVIWSSDLQETINTDPPNAIGVATFSIDELEGGTHTITVTATDSAGAESSASLSVTISPYDEEWYDVSGKLSDAGLPSWFDFDDYTTCSDGSPVSDAFFINLWVGEYEIDDDQWLGTEVQVQFATRSLSSAELEASGFPVCIDWPDEAECTNIWEIALEPYEDEPGSIGECEDHIFQVTAEAAFSSCGSLVPGETEEFLYSIADAGTDSTKVLFGVDPDFMTPWADGECLDDVFRLVSVICSSVPDTGK